MTRVMELVCQRSNALCAAGRGGGQESMDGLSAAHAMGQEKNQAAMTFRIQKLIRWSLVLSGDGTS